MSMHSAVPVYMFALPMLLVGVACLAFFIWVVIRSWRVSRLRMSIHPVMGVDIVPRKVRSERTLFMSSAEPKHAPAMTSL